MSKPPINSSFFQKKALINTEDKENVTSRKEGIQKMNRLPKNRLSKHPETPPCKIYSEQDFIRYFKNEITAWEYKDFAKHLVTCFPCRQKSEKVRLKDLMENERLQMKALIIMDAIDRGKSNDQAKLEAERLELLQIFVRGTQTSFDVAATSGKLLESTESSTRGDAKEGVKILQEFSGSGLAVLAGLSEAGPWRMNMRVIIYDRSTNKFLSGISVCLKKETEILDNKISNTEGELLVEMDTRQRQTLSLSNGQDLLGYILISVAQTCR